ncbi:lysophospholipid acyltransferase family protein [Bradyrhizobium sp. CCGUVB4N]|uniref:lysophospholipid acyltransferase family protein n=1 Tax=Bradyrhizobium sp. CCGUVB4N TaxID=2949631 RepID=UPI0020B1EEB2|nr:lysophospholipid acyltransferase family protein [Bradyrhizobium sp. CCGUVB4N]MCP3384022.1 lysophospholipid acyltransferase family protein [Bradyrhizobium sp. CCGUVB4N]
MTFRETAAVTDPREANPRPFPREHGDIQTAVVNLVDGLASIIPVARQVDVAREIASVIAQLPSTMRNNMFLRQSIIRRGTATADQVIDGLAAWVTVLFDLANLQQDRDRAMSLEAKIPKAALGRLARALSKSRNGCIIAVPHIGSLELFAAHLRNRGFNVGFVYSIGRQPTPTERWIYAGRSATAATPIAFARRNTGAEISRVLQNNGVVFMVVDVYPSAKYAGITVKTHDSDFRYPPGPARYARTGTLVLPGFASRRDAAGFSMNILAPIEYRTWMPAEAAASEFTQEIAAHVDGFTVEQPAAYWLWHPIPNDPYLAIAQRQRPDLLTAMAPADDEAVARTVEAAHAKWSAPDLIDPILRTEAPPLAPSALAEGVSAD